MDKIEKFFSEHPFIAWNIFTLIALFVSPPIAIPFFVVSLILYARKHSQLKKEKREEKRLALAKEAKEYFEEAQAKKSLTPIVTSVFLDNNEHAFLEEETQLKETRSIRRSGGAGIGFRIAKGIYVGGYSGQAESHKEWRTLDIGKLILTNKKLIFRGSKENRVIPLIDILALDSFADAIGISLASRAKPIIFPVRNPYIWNALIQILRNVKDPTHLEGIDLDLKFQ